LLLVGRDSDSWEGRSRFRLPPFTLDGVREWVADELQLISSLLCSSELVAIDTERGNLVRVWPNPSCWWQ